jgi:hypothetical protein
MDSGCPETTAAETPAFSNRRVSVRHVPGFAHAGGNAAGRWSDAAGSGYQCAWAGWEDTSEAKATMLER